MHLSLVKDTMFVLSTRGVPSRDLFVSYSYSSPFLSLQHIALSVHTLSYTVTMRLIPTLLIERLVDTRNALFK